MTRSRDVADTQDNLGGAVAPYVGAKNFALNGSFDIWQRGTTFTSTGSGYVAYTTDRWTCYAQGTGTISQDTSLSANGFRYALKFTSTQATGGNDFYQLMDTDQVVSLAGKQVAVSGYCLAPSGKTPLMNLEYSTTVNDGLFGAYIQCAATTYAQPTATGSLLRYTYSFAVPSTAKTLRLRASTGTLNNTEATIWTGIQVEIGNVPTSFSRAGGSVGGELALCQRYFYAWNTANANDANGNICYLAANTSVAVYGTLQYPVTMRTAPSFSASAASGFQYYMGSARVLSSITQPRASIYASMLNGAVTGATVGQSGWLEANNNTGYLWFSAEL
jgi:hypothetical protein